MLKTKRSIHLLYFLIWFLVFLGPYLKNLQHTDPLAMKRMVGEWIFLAVLLVVFLINLYILVPKLLFNNKRSKYGLILGITILAGIFVDVILHQLFVSHEIANIPDHLYDFNNEAPFAQFSLVGTVFNNLIVSVLIIGSSTAFELLYKWLDAEKIRKDLEKEQLKTNLALLRHQVSPHFLMNTLNNIHSLIEMDAAKAQNEVERLSILMRYLLYESAHNTIELKKEIEFIKSFVSLMQLRHSEEVDVKIVFPGKIPDVKIPPMLFISLLENAFKHGVSYPLKSYIYFEIKLDSTSLFCFIKNSKHNKTVNSQGEYSGIGLENIKESLKLLYEDNFEFTIFDRETEFEVNLKIPL